MVRKHTKRNENKIKHSFLGYLGTEFPFSSFLYERSVSGIEHLPYYSLFV